MNERTFCWKYNVVFDDQKGLKQLVGYNIITRLIILTFTNEFHSTCSYSEKRKTREPDIGSFRIIPFDSNVK